MSFEERIPKLADVSDPHVVAELLLFYLRERFEPILGYKLYGDVLKLGGKTEPQKSKTEDAIERACVRIDGRLSGRQMKYI